MARHQSSPSTVGNLQRCKGIRARGKADFQELHNSQQQTIHVPSNPACPHITTPPTHILPPSPPKHYHPAHPHITTHALPPSLPTHYHPAYPHITTQPTHTSPPSLPTHYHPAYPHISTQPTHTLPPSLPTHYHPAYPHISTQPTHTFPPSLPARIKASTHPVRGAESGKDKSWRQSSWN